MSDSESKSGTVPSVDDVVIGCVNCGLPLVKNHHPDAGKPECINVVGCPSGCLPCAEKRANGRRRVISGLRMWLEDQLQIGSDEEVRCLPSAKARHATLTEVLAKLNELEESRRVAYQASR